MVISHTLEWVTQKLPKKQRTVYNQPYYQVQAMIRDEWFIERINWLRKRFEEVGCPVPIEGFATNDEYEAWRETYWNRYSEMNQGEEYKAKQLAISGGKEKLTYDEFMALEDLRDGYLPPMYGGVFREILEHYKLDHKDQQFKYFLEFYVFRGRRELPQSNFSVRLARHHKTNELELLIKLKGFTKKEDIMASWDFIAQDQKYLPDYQGKSKPWVEFERDLEIYRLYQKIRREKLGRQITWQSVDMDIYAQLHAQYPEITTTSIRTIVTRTAERLGEK